MLVRPQVALIPKRQGFLSNALKPGRFFAHDNGRYGNSGGVEKEGLPDFDGAFGNRDVLALGGSGFLHEGRDKRRGSESGLQFAVFIEELRAPNAVIRKDFAELRAAGNQDDDL